MAEKLEAAHRRRLGRAVAFVHMADNGQIPPITAAEIEPLLLAGRAMDFAARLKDFKPSQLTREVVENFAKTAGIGPVSLLTHILPVLKRTDVVNWVFALKLGPG